MKTSFIGLGAMGFPMAGHLGRKGFPVTVWNRSPEAAARHHAVHGTRVAALLEETADAEAIFTCLPTSREVASVAEALLPVLGPGRVWVDATSGDPETSRHTAARLAERGVEFLDAPVSGGVGGAEKGSLTVMVGGEADVLERVRPALLAFAAKVVHCGPIGAGHAMKAVNNTMLAIHILAAAEGLFALERNGIALHTALEVLNSSSGRSHVTEKLLPGPLLSGEFPLSFKLGLLEKDVRIGSHVVAASGINAPLTALAVEVVRNETAELGRDVDYLELVRLVSRKSG